MKTQIILIFIIFSTVAVFSESKSQSEIRKERRFKIAGFKIGNKLNSFLVSYNLNEHLTIGLQYRKIASIDNTSSPSKVTSNESEKDESIFLQWFPFKLGGLNLVIHAGRFQVLEKKSTLYYSGGISNANYESYTINISKPLLGAGVGYSWTFENGISLGLEYIQFKNYGVNSARNYNSIIFSNRSTTPYDYAINNYLSYYNLLPNALFFSLGYSF